MATIVIDAGHGGFDNGAMYQGRKEKNDNLDLALAVGNLLKQKGYDVIFTRDSDVYQSPYEKAQIANEAGADYFLSFHRNAAEQDNTYNGVQTLIYSWDDPRAGQLAGVINEGLEKLGFQNLGIEERTGLVVLRQTEMPVEQTVPLTQNAASQEHKDGNSYSGMQMDGSVVYGVEAGRFGYHTTANFLAEQLEDQGFSSYVFEEDGIVHVVAGKEDSLEDALEIQKKLRDLGYQTLIIAAKRE